MDHTAPPGFPPGRAGAKQLSTMYIRAFPDAKFAINHTIGEDDKVVIHWTVSATHTGEFLGIPPTHKRATVSGIVIYRFVNEKIAEAWTVFDQVSLMQQLGVMPAPGK